MGINLLVEEERVMLCGGFAAQKHNFFFPAVRF